MDGKYLADILQELNKFQVPHETKEEHEIVFGEAENNADGELFEDSDGDYEP